MGSGGANESLSTIQSSCAAGSYLMYTGWDDNDSENLLVLAAAPRTSVFSETIASCFNTSNGNDNH